MRTPYDSRKEVGTAAERARNRAGMTKVALAKETGISRKRIGHIEDGLKSALGETPEEWFTAVAPIAAATGDLSLIGLDDLGDRAELVSLRRDVDRLVHRLEGLEAALVAGDLLDTAEIDRILDSLDTTEPPQGEVPGEDEGLQHG